MSITDRELTTIAFCWRVERRDGVAVGFTSHDRDLSFDGLVYRAAPGVVPSAIVLSDGLEPDNFEVRGALTTDGLRVDDLVAGRWDGAALSVLMADWSDPDAAPLLLVRGELGDVSTRRAGFEAELRGPTAALEASVAEQTSPECRAQLGDKRCRVDMAPRTKQTRIAAVATDGALEVAGGAEDNAYGFGSARWLSGPNSGLEAAIAESGEGRLIMREPPPYPIGAGDLIEIREGCDKSFATCGGRFANSANFRGEPHLPGMDLLTRYPGS